MYVCVNGKGKDTFDSIDIDGVYCDLTCPEPGALCDMETGVIRKWSSNSWEDMACVKDDIDDDWQYGTP